MIQRLAPLLRRVDRDLKGFLDLCLADEFVQPRGAESGISQPLVGERFGRSDLRARAIAHAALVPRGRARHRTGRASRSSAWRVWQLDRKSTRLNSSHTVISYAVFCLK